MQVNLIQYTRDAKDVLIFSKRTRHMTDVSAYDDVKKMSEEQKNKELDYVFNTIGSSWEFIDYIFLITEVTRAFTHQLVRHRVGTSFAQQAQRVANMENFDYLRTGSCDKMPHMKIYNMCMEEIASNYKKLMDMGARAQDARGVLPTNILTNIMFKANLRTLSGIADVRLCIRAQGEFQKVCKAMVTKVLAIHPWTKPVLAPHCIRTGFCMWPRYQECPLKEKYNLDKREDSEELIKDWEKLVGYDPQPSAHSWEE